MADQAVEIQQLRACIGDAISLLALPTKWNGREPSHLIGTVLDLLVRMLRLDFAFAFIRGAPEGMDVLRFADRLVPANKIHQAREALNQWVASDLCTASFKTNNPIGEGQTNVAPLRLGLQDELGVFMVGSQRTDFPTETELLLLRIAANETAIGLQEAHRLDEQKETAAQLDRLVAHRTQQLNAANQELREEIAERVRAEQEEQAQVDRDATAWRRSQQELINLKDELSIELTAMTKLHGFSMRMFATTELRPLLEGVLDSVISVQGADFGNIQLYDPENKSLEIVVQRGFQKEFLDYFAVVRDDSSHCGQALRRGKRVIITDVQTDPSFQPHRAIADAAGFRGMQCTPLVSRLGQPLGIISTHFRKPHRSSEQDLRYTDLYARDAAEMIERKQAEEKLRCANERIEMILGSITDRFFSLDSRWRFTGFNQHAEEQLRLLGKNPVAILGKVLWEEFPSPPVEDAFRQAMRERVPITHEHYYPPLKEWVENTIYPTADGGLAIFQRYVTQRKQAEAQMRRSEAYLAHGQRLSHTASWALNVETGDLYWSHEHFRICGLDPGSLKPTLAKFFHTVHPEDLDTVRQTFDRAVAVRSDYELEFRIVRPNGEIRHIHSLAHPIPGEKDTLEYVGTIIDVTERVRANEQLNTALEEIKVLRDKLAQEKLYLEEELRTEQGFEEIIGESGALKNILKQVEVVAPTESTVLIYGETGTGKELIARAIHNLSRRRERTFVKVNCAAIPTGLVESELFGHEKGAFTGAMAQRIGRFELANGGTIFLDEVGEIELDSQAKLLRVLQEQEFERLGSSKTIHIDVRMVAASNRDLGKMVAERQFRSDLYYRLKVFPIEVPPLRERADDIPQLVRHFTQKYARRMKKPVERIATETMLALCKYSWPGNIRELENYIERSVILSEGDALDAPLGELRIHHGAGEPRDSRTLEGVERQHILDALKQSHWVVGGPNGAAAKLGVKRTSLQYKMQKLKIDRPRSSP